MGELVKELQAPARHLPDAALRPGVPHAVVRGLLRADAGVLQARLPRRPPPAPLYSCVTADRYPDDPDAVRELVADAVGAHGALPGDRPGDVPRRRARLRRSGTAGQPDRLHRRHPARQALRRHPVERAAPLGPHPAQPPGRAARLPRGADAPRLSLRASRTPDPRPPGGGHGRSRFTRREARDGPPAAAPSGRLPVDAGGASRGATPTVPPVTTETRRVPAAADARPRPPFPDDAAVPEGAGAGHGRLPGRPAGGRRVARSVTERPARLPAARPGRHRARAGAASHHGPALRPGRGPAVPAPHARAGRLRRRPRPARTRRGAAHHHHGDAGRDGSPAPSRPRPGRHAQPPRVALDHARGAGGDTRGERPRGRSGRRGRGVRTRAAVRRQRRPRGGRGHDAVRGRLPARARGPGLRPARRAAVLVARRAALPRGHVPRPVLPGR